MEVLVALGYLSALAVYGFPMLTTMRDVKRAQSVGRRSAVPYVAALLTCGLFVLYGLTPPRREALIVRNALGVPFQAVYTGVFLFYYAPVHRVLSLLYIVPGLVGFGALLGFFFAGMLDALVLGYLCAAAGSATPLLPFLRVRIIWGTRSMEGMPSALLATFSIINGFIWTYNTFEAKPRDLLTVVPNGVAALSAVLLLLMHLACWLWKPKPVTHAADDTKTPLLPATEPPTDSLEGDGRGQDGNVAGGVDNIA